MQIELKDGETIIVTSSETSAFDPTGNYKNVRAFRVVSVIGPKPVLELIPIGSTEIMPVTIGI
jgi:hypothetical protein